MDLRWSGLPPSHWPQETSQKHWPCWGKKLVRCRFWSSSFSAFLGNIQKLPCVALPTRRLRSARTSPPICGSRCWGSWTSERSPAAGRRSPAIRRHDLSGSAIGLPISWGGARGVNAGIYGIHGASGYWKAIFSGWCNQRETRGFSRFFVEPGVCSESRRHHRHYM